MSWIAIGIIFLGGCKAQAECPAPDEIAQLARAFKNEPLWDARQLNALHAGLTVAAAKANVPIWDDAKGLSRPKGHVGSWSSVLRHASTAIIDRMREFSGGESLRDRDLEAAFIEAMTLDGIGRDAASQIYQLNAHGVNVSLIGDLMVFQGAGEGRWTSIKHTRDCALRSR